ESHTSPGQQPAPTPAAEPELTGSGRWAPPPPTTSSPATASSRPRRTSPTSTTTPSAASRAGALPHQLGVLTVP
ncbi:unnamed protein product, partial [Musa textilis]